MVNQHLEAAEKGYPFFCSHCCGNSMRFWLLRHKPLSINEIFQEEKT